MIYALSAFAHHATTLLSQQPRVAIGLSGLGAVTLTGMLARLVLHLPV
ncbi:hypothetical protein LZK98_05105 [Sphingomonas cannabina]|nr:hypothetical protein [Sphingomonas cannabina]UIJ46323.1 hypothetical protein LZK98_05105 [Sphingomonas cannabina]